MIPRLANSTFASTIRCAISTRRARASQVSSRAAIGRKDSFGRPSIPALSITSAINLVRIDLRELYYRVAVQSVMGANLLGCVLQVGFADYVVALED